MRAAFILTTVLATTLATAARGDVKAIDASGFRLENRTTIAAPPEKVYAALGRIGSWWDDAHTYSGKASNMTLELRPGACFCEALEGGGGVEHGRVVLAWPGQMLRLDAALGPLQDEGVAGALTFTLKPATGGRTEVIQTYNVGGVRADMLKNTMLINQVVGGQLARLKTWVETGKPK